MTPRHVDRVRAGVTLIELLVVMAIITALGLLALMLLPGISNSDAALKGTEEVRAQIKIAQALAGAARQPRGVRFLTGNPDVLANNTTVSTELQLIETPLVTAIDPLALQARSNGVNGPNTSGVSGPYVDVVYELYNGTESSIDPGFTGTPPANAIKQRHCYIVGLSAAQKAQVEPGALLYMPTLGAWSRIANKTDPAVGPPPGYTLAGNTIEVDLDVFPDAAMGASTFYRTYHAGIYGVPVPLLGVPTVPLPKNIGVDLEVSTPTLRSLQPNRAVPTAPPAVPYDLLFAPDGQTLLIGRNYNNAGVYLWVRDITKVVNPGAANQFSMARANFLPVPPAPPAAVPPSAAYYDAFRRGGEHHAVAVNNGAVGVAPINWPDASGLYPANTDPFLLARRKTN